MSTKKTIKTSKQPRLDVQVNDLHVPHPRIRAEDWVSPLVNKLLDSKSYEDGTKVFSDSYRDQSLVTNESEINLSWSELKSDFERCVNTYQESVLTEFATLGLACILVHHRANNEITEVTRRGEKVDYWLGDKELLLEVSGRIDCDIDNLCETKAKGQLLQNPFNKDGYVCVANFSTQLARLWYYPIEEEYD